MNTISKKVDMIGQSAGSLKSIVLKEVPGLMPGLSGVRRNFEKDTTLAYEGDTLSHIYEVTSGTIKTTKLLADGRRIVISFYGPGDIIGLPMQSTTGVSIETVSHSTVIFYSVAQVEAAMRHSPTLSKTILARIHGEFERHTDHLISLGRKRPAERVATFLLRYRDKTSGSQPNNADICLPMSRIDIADYLGLTQETVCRVLTDFKRRGLIRAKRSNHITITDSSNLENMAEACQLH